jgi:hypothetical protein
MKQTLKRSSILLLLLPLLFYSCSKKETDEMVVTPSDSWKISDHFLYNYKIQLNSYVDETGLYLLGYEGLSKIHYEGEVEYATRYTKFTKMQVGNKYPLNRDIFTETNLSSVYFTSTQNPIQGGRIARLDMTDIDPAFARFNFSPNESAECLGLTKNNVALIPYQVYDTNSSSTPVINGAKLLLVKVELTGADNDIPKVSNTIVIDNIRMDAVNYIQVFNDYFYVVYGSEKLVRISEEGDVEELMSNWLVPMFRHSGSLYGFYRDRLYKSASGKDWNEILGLTSNATLFDLPRLNYHTLSNGELIATYNSQLFKVELSENRILLKELDNSGLDGNKITSIARFKDKIYLTTLSGVFYRGEDQFLTLKQDRDK